MRFYNRVVDKKQLRALISWAFTHHGTAKTAKVADRLKDLGFRYATRAGVSISVEDLQVPPSKQELLAAAQKEIDITEARYTRGEITEVERFQKVIDTWSTTSEELKDDVVTNFKESNPLNSVYMMAFSGARGNISQVRQLVGMRGLMANPQGEIIDLPIKTNFREGLTVTEYIISSYGARKGLVDTALRTADSGYLTRRLVDVSQDTIVREIDCGTQRSIPLQSMRSGERVAIPLEDRLLGRVLAEDVVHPETGEFITATLHDRTQNRNYEVSSRRNQVVSEELAQAIVDAGVNEVRVRSALTCEAARSVCQHCYGWSLAHAEMVDLGEAVGIIAAQSIGEPGTQLTMRTFHTGGVFTGEVARPAKSPFDGIARYSSELKTRPFRTRHGEDAFVVEQAGELVIEPSDSSKKSISIALPQGSTLTVEDGAPVETDRFVAEVPIGSARTRKNTEKATKDVASDLNGEVKFAGVIPEEKKDRQGNTTVIAARGGLLWILSGEVYNMPPGAHPVVKNGDTVKVEDVLAVTETPTENGGIVRLKPDNESDPLGEVPSDSALAPRETVPKEVEIITASVRLDSAKVTKDSIQGRDQYTIETQEGQEFTLTATPGTKVRNGQVVAELKDSTYKTSTGGIIKYGDIEVAKRGKGSKTGYEITKGGTLLWIPEETHEINKDISLLEVEDGQYVEAGTEVVKDIYCQTSGIVEVIQKNDILREISVKSGDLHLLDLSNGGELSVSEETIVSPGQEIAPGITADRLCYVEGVMTPEGAGVLLRPVEEFQVPDTPSVPNQQPAEGQENAFPIALRAIQRLMPFKDGDRIKSVDGQELIRTQLVLDIGNDARHLEADIELVPAEEDDTMRLQLVVLESLIIRRETAALDPLFNTSTSTRLLVQDGDQIEPGAVVARTEICCRNPGIVRGIREGAEATRRILVVSEADRFSVDLGDDKPKVKVGDLLVSGATVTDNLNLEESGQVVAIEGSKLVLRHARPYRVSPGAILHVDDGSLVQRGDNLVLLVFERAKTGDIIQGLPRIEELLEARKPKEACLLNRRPGTAQVIYEEDESVEIRIIEDDGTISEYKPSSGQNVLVVDGQRVDVAEPLTDGPANPHEILESWFEFLQPSGTYEAALTAFQNVQTFLVNEVQSVYQSQGIDISDKHIEVIVRQMTSKVKIDDGGDTTMLPGELIELRQVEQVNEAMSITGGAPAQYTPMLLGITKASLNTDSFISAASFQETTRVLTEAAIEGKSDWLRGLKENVIIGRLIPAGTGFNAYEEMNFSAPDADINAVTNGVDDDSDLQDVVLDDRTARAYNLSGSVSDGSAILSDDDEDGSSAILDDESDAGQNEEDDDPTD